MDKLQILPATPDDVPALLGMVRELAEFERLLHAVDADEPLFHEALFGSHPACEAVLARVGSEVVGFALYFHNFSTFRGRRGLYLEDLYVRPSARGQGVGKALLLHLGRLAVLLEPLLNIRLTLSLGLIENGAGDIGLRLRAEFLRDICEFCAVALAELF